MPAKEHSGADSSSGQKRPPQQSTQSAEVQIQPVHPAPLIQKDRFTPSLHSPPVVMALQRMLGNQVVQKLVSSVLQRYDDNSLEAIRNIPLQEVLRIFCMDQDLLPVTASDGTTVRFTREWVNSQRGIAILRGEIRHSIQTQVHTGSEAADQVQRWIDSITGPEDRIQELRQTLTRAIEREADPTIADASAVSSSLVEEGRQGRTMAVRGRLRGPLRRRPGETDEALAERTREKEREVHSAMDVPGSPGTAIYAPTAGRVIWAGPGDPGGAGMGIYVRIVHDHPPQTEIAGDRPLVTHFCHLQETLVQAGDEVQANQAIGLVGFTTENARGRAGSVTPLTAGGAHLHFGVLISPTAADGTPNPGVSPSTVEEVSRGINPAIWLSELGARLDEVGYRRPRLTGTRGRMADPPARAETPEETSEESLVQETPLAEGQPLQRKEVPKTVVQLSRPQYIVAHNFLGTSIPLHRGVHPDMVPRLDAVEAHLQAQYEALPASERARYPTLNDYAGVQTIRGWRETTSQHGTGRAVDVNYADQPYIATRTIVGGSPVYGGEQGGATTATRALRRPAVDVYDRAVDFTRMSADEAGSADVGNRRVGESATAVYRRFRRTSDALRDYLSLAFRTDYSEVDRVPVPNPASASEEDLLSAIPTSERYDEETAIANIQAYMSNTSWIDAHPEYYITAREQYFQILRDYETVRRPMQMGNPSTSPAHTRNPARGFLHLPEHFVVAMMDIGHFRWGACEFSAASNGDVHHFDMVSPHHEP